MRPTPGSARSWTRRSTETTRGDSPWSVSRRERTAVRKGPPHDLRTSHGRDRWVRRPGHRPLRCSDQAEGLTCEGRPATVVGPTGTEGDDVMVAPLDAGVTVEGLGGDDLICRSRDPVADETRCSSPMPAPATTSSHEATYVGSRGLGRPLVGNDVGVRTLRPPGVERLASPSGVGRTQVAAITDAGRRRLRVRWRSTPATPEGLVEQRRLGSARARAGRQRLLRGSDELTWGAGHGPVGDRVFLVSTWPTGTLEVDHVARRSTLAGSTVLPMDPRRARLRLSERPDALVGKRRGRPRPSASTRHASPGPAMSRRGRNRSGERRSSPPVGSRERATGPGKDSLALGGGCRPHSPVRLGSAYLCAPGRTVARAAGWPGSRTSHAPRAVRTRRQAPQRADRIFSSRPRARASVLGRSGRRAS